MSSYFLSITDGDKGYEKVSLALPGRETTLEFYSGKPEVDYFRALRWILGESEEDLEKYPVLLSSSIDHFPMDNEGFSWIEVHRISVLIKEGRTFEDIREEARTYNDRPFPVNLGGVKNESSGIS